MITKVKEFIEEFHMLEDAKRIVVGVSGGADSVCLLHVLKELRDCNKIGAELLAVHVNHGIRGAAAEQDQHFVEELCRNWKVSCRVFREDIPKLAKERGMTEEEAGRAFRYLCFSQVAKEQLASVVAVAHHKEDQAETILFRMARGTGIDGLVGMQPISERDGIRVIRPFLCLHRQEIETYMKEKAIDFCTDETNHNSEYSRNYIRHELLPQMEYVNQQAVEHICQMSRQADAVMEYVNQQAEFLFWQQVGVERDIFRQKTGFLKINVNWLLSQHPVICTIIIRQMLVKAGGGLKDIERRHLELIQNMLANPDAKRIDLPYGLEAFICYENLLIGKNKKGINCENLVKYFDFSEIFPDKVAEIKKKSYTKTIDCAKIKGMLTVRYRQPGDFITIDCQGHQKSLNRYFIDEKIPKHIRERIPLVCDGGQIVWIVGYRLNPAYYVTEVTKRALQMTFYVPEAEEGEEIWKKKSR